jgi:hypothetical protein
VPAHQRVHGGKLLLSLDPLKRTYVLTRLRWSDAFLAPFGPCTHWVKRHPMPMGLVTCGDTVEFADASVDPGL